MEARLPRDAERDLDFVFLAFLLSSEELLEDEPARAGAATMGCSVAATGASVVSAGFGVASVLFLGADAVAAASVVGLPACCQSTAKLVGSTSLAYATCDVTWE